MAGLSLLMGPIPALKDHYVLLTLARLCAVGVSVMGGALIYLGVAKMMKIPEAEVFVSGVMRRLKRKKA
jgi:hypothetical protein